MHAKSLRAGSMVVFAKDKNSLSPGKRATEISPLPKGDSYSYIVEKYWIVKELHEDGTVTLLTRRGKEHTVPLDDPRLRKARFWERWFRASRFPDPNHCSPTNGDK